jgi:hypothetical protein
MPDLPASVASIAGVLLNVVDVVGVPGSRTTPDGTVDDGGAMDPGAAGDAIGNGVEMASRFLFAIPDEVKTGLMLLLAVAIGVYLYLNWIRDQP